MINYIKNKQINQTKWNDCILDSMNFRVFACSWYLDLVCDDWDALILDDYEAVMPLPYRIKRGQKYIFPPFFAPQLGVFSKMPVNEALLIDFLKAIPENFRFAEFRLNTQIKAPEFYETKRNKTYLLALVEPYEQLFAKFSQNTKRNIKKAEKEGLNIFETGSLFDLVKMFKANKISEKSSFTESDYHRLERLMHIHLSMHFGQLLMVYDKQNTLQAGGFFVVIGTQSYFMFSGRAESSDKNGAMHFLISEFIKRNSGKNLVLDFCGSNNDSLARFYQGFGSDCAYYQEVRVFPKNIIFRKIIFKLYKWLKRRIRS